MLNLTSFDKTSEVLSTARSRYCATSGVNVLARRFMLASKGYIFSKSANVKVCQYQVMISSGLFEETNEQHIFYKVFGSYVLMV